MGSSAPAAPSSREAEFMESLRQRYLEQGYEFIEDPHGDDLPPLGTGYIPDAVAKKAGQRIAIEVKRRQPSSGLTGLQELRQRFAAIPGWQLSVFFTNSGSPEIELPPASAEALNARVAEVRALKSAGFIGPAFVMAWALLEAVLRKAETDSHRKPQKPGTVIQALEMDGYIDSDLGEEIRSLVALRNRMVHGDVNVEPQPEQVDLLLKAVNQALDMAHA